MVHEGIEEAFTAIKCDPNGGLIVYDTLGRGELDSGFAQRIQALGLCCVSALVIVDREANCEGLIEECLKLSSVDVLFDPLHQLELSVRIRSLLNGYGEKLNEQRSTGLPKALDLLAICDEDNAVWDWNLNSGNISFPGGLPVFLSDKDVVLGQGESMWRAIIHSEDFALFEKALQSFREGLTPTFMVEHRLKQTSGGECWVLTRGKTLTDGEGHEIRMVGTITNVTTVKEVAVQSSQIEKNEEFDRFAGSIAHDLGNMVMVVKTYCRFIDESVGEHQKELKDYIQEIRQATEYSSKLVNQLLALSKRSQIQLEYVFLSEEMENLRRMVQSAIGDGIRLKTELTASITPIMADHTMISQLLLNLVLNARDAMRANGVLFLKTYNYFLEETRIEEGVTIGRGNYVVLSVRDNGIGMDESTRVRIFEPFFTTKTGEGGMQGTGLGLSTVNSIVRNHKGWIEVDSAPGQGAEFRAYFPALEEF